jgi:hypothetical protein
MKKLKVQLAEKEISTSLIFVCWVILTFLDAVTKYMKEIKNWISKIPIYPIIYGQC